MADQKDAPKKDVDLTKLKFDEIRKSFEGAAQSADLPKESKNDLSGLSGLMVGVLAFSILAMVVAIGMKVVRNSIPGGAAKDAEEAKYRFIGSLGLFIIAFVMVLVFIYAVTIV